MREKLLVIGAAVIGEGVLVMLPAMVLVEEGHFGVDAVAEIDAMGEVLRRGQHQLGQGEVAGVEVQRPGLGVAGGAGVLLLPGVGLQFDFDQRGGIEGRRKGQEDLAQPGAHGRLVVVGFPEVERRAFQGRRAPGFGGPAAGPPQRGLVAAEGGQHEQGGGMGACLAHGATSRRGTGNRTLL